jgi:soluble cytochrome b562
MGGFVSANRLCSARLKNTAKQALKRNETLMPSRQTPAEIAEDILEKKRQSIPSKINISGYSEAYQELAVVISKSTHSWQKREKQITQIVKRLSTSEEHNPWRNQEGMKLAHLLFGDLRAPFIANIWDSFSNLPYQSSWSRRSFRILCGARPRF